MPDIVWRCYRASDEDVKFAAIEDHKLKLEAKGYVCELDPDADWSKEEIYDPDQG